MNILRLTGEVGWDILAEDVAERLDAMSGDVTIHVDSVGGDVFVGTAIHQAIKNYKSGKVTAVIGALAASSMSYIILAADEIHVYENSTYMIHEARVSVWSGSSKELSSKAVAVDGINQLYIDAYVKKSGRSAEDIALLMDSETYFFGESIVEIGFADKLLVDEAMSAKAENSLEFSRNRITACKNNCASRPSNATPPVARKEPNLLLDEVNKIMESIK